MFRPLYNVQLLNDVDAPFVLGYRAVAQVNDAGLMGEVLGRQRELLGRQVADLLADSGYTAGADSQAAAAARVTVYAPWQENDYTTAKEKAGGKKIPKAEFTYLPGEDLYRCPEGNRLGRVGQQAQARQTSGRVTPHVYQAREEDCRGCRRRPECTSSGTGGRTVSRSEYDGLIETLRVRMQGASGKGLYRLRRQSGEQLNADFKSHRKLRAFSGRGLVRVSSEVALVVFANNLVSGEAERAKKAAPLTHSPEIGMSQEYRLL